MKYLIIRDVILFAKKRARGDVTAVEPVKKYAMFVKRSRYMPHQGASECDRRLRKLSQAVGVNLP